MVERAVKTTAVKAGDNPDVVLVKFLDPSVATNFDAVRVLGRIVLSIVTVVPDLPSEIAVWVIVPIARVDALEASIIFDNRELDPVTLAKTGDNPLIVDVSCLDPFVATNPDADKVDIILSLAFVITVPDLPSEIAVWVAVPIDRVPALATSKLGDFNATDAVIVEKVGDIPDIVFVKFFDPSVATKLDAVNPLNPNPVKTGDNPLIVDVNCLDPSVATNPDAVNGTINTSL